MIKKVGVIGGTFDPVHTGHLLLAEQAREEMALEEILFMPARIQPFKQDKNVTDEEKRQAMLALAVKDNPFFRISKIELNRKDISYTIYTLRECKRQMEANTEIFFIMGTDTFLEIEKWYMSKELLTESSFLIGIRPGYRESELLQYIQRIRETYGTNITFMNNRPFEVSSTEIKQRVAQGRSIRYLVPREVEEYIYDTRLYL